MTNELGNAYTFVLRRDQIPALNDAFAYAIESMTSEARGSDEPDSWKDLRCVQALCDDMQRQMYEQAGESDDATADGAEDRDGR